MTLALTNNDDFHIEYLLHTYLCTVSIATAETFIRSKQLKDNLTKFEWFSNELGSYKHVIPSIYNIFKTSIYHDANAQQISNKI